jgi:ATP-dependent Lhr-like helicase
MKAFDLLNEPIKKYIWDQGWKKFYPIQEAAIIHILRTKDNYILASPTASGKTEAAFFPVISSIKDWKGGIKILYISPLIALINDQFLRIEKLCEHLDILITKWHGEANRTKKNKLIRNPEGIILITPESIESIFVNHPEYLGPLFGDIKYIIVDEIHSFLGTPRGKHLQSLISRLEQVNKGSSRYIGLSATISKESYNSVKKFWGNPKVTKILLDKTRNKINAEFKYYHSDTSSLTPELLGDIYINTQKNKSLIFPNTRGRVEEIAVKLKRIAKKRKGHLNYFAHHSSIDRDLREFIEHFAKTSSFHNFAISCTSTLELGIDIGSMDTIIQVDSTFSISSLIQRLGRSGRKPPHINNLILYATNPWSLLQSIACYELYNEGFIEPKKDISQPLDILLHQILSIIKEKSGLPKKQLMNEINKNMALRNVSKEDLDILISHLIKKEILEQFEREIIIGLGGEKIIGKKDYYSVFDSRNDLKVIYKDKIIGEIPLSNQVVPNANIFLAARIWKIKEIDTNRGKIFIDVARDGKKPIFFGTGGDIHNRVREKMLEILYSNQDYPFLNSGATMILKDFRKQFMYKKIEDIQTDRPLFEEANRCRFFSFSSTRINRTLYLFLKFIGITEVEYKEEESSFKIGLSSKEIRELLKKRIPKYTSFIDDLRRDIEKFPESYKFSKWGKFLPTDLKVKLLLDSTYDLLGTEDFISKINIRT